MIPINFLIIIFQVILLAAFAPLVSGLIRKIKNTLRMRKGPGVFQPYYNFFKLLSKDEVVSQNTSWIFKAAPLVVAASSLSACFLIPLFRGGVSLDLMGGIIALVFIFALDRFFLALAALDAASAFGGMGSSREMFISSLAEPALLVTLFVFSLNCNSTTFTAVSTAHAFRFSTFLAWVALVMVAIAETSRIPVDNEETHLELTMVHEAMILEYSGKSLGLIELALQIKQVILFTIISWVVFPASVNVLLDFSLFPLRIILISVVIAVTEVSLAKMRLFRVVDYLGFAFFIAILSAVASAIGV